MLDSAARRLFNPHSERSVGQFGLAHFPFERIDQDAKFSRVTLIAEVIGSCFQLVEKLNETSAGP